MIQIETIQTPLQTKMIALILDNANRMELVEKKHIEVCVHRLYGEKARITKISINNSLPHLEANACLDYIIEVEAGSKKHVMYNFACCFLDSKDCAKLYKNNVFSRVMECLQALRKERVARYPLYYKDYTQKIISKYEATIKD